VSKFARLALAFHVAEMLVFTNGTRIRGVCQKEIVIIN